MRAIFKLFKWCVLSIAGFALFYWGDLWSFHYLPRSTAVLEHITRLPPRQCRILNVKELRGSGEIQWLIARNNQTGKTSEHIRGYKNGKIVDVTCASCEETASCGTFAIKDYKIVSATFPEKPCAINGHDLKQWTRYQYLKTALFTDELIDLISPFPW
jgi:hypothetical protein